MEAKGADQVSIPHSNAFVDFDGDCMPDIFLTRQSGPKKFYYEIYIQKILNGKQ